MKKEFVIVMVALIFCSFFGLGYIALFGDKTISEDSGEASTTTSTIHIFVNQVGIYSTKENALNASNEILSYVDNTYILEKGGQYILLTLITQDQNTASSQKGTLEASSFSVLTKEYDVSSEFSDCFISGDYASLLEELESR